jgi:alpha-beta hydrolase superfamily lysophospholipase
MRVAVEVSLHFTDSAILHLGTLARHSGSMGGFLSRPATVHVPHSPDEMVLVAPMCRAHRSCKQAAM